jgi:hypothetical protein
MNTALLIEKDGNLTITNIKNTSKLYYLCNYRNDTNFENLYTWKNTLVTYELWGKKKTKGSVKNIYQLPYPIDKEVFYGALCVVKKINQEYTNMTMEDWILIMNKFKSNDKEKNEETINEEEENIIDEEEEEDTFKCLLRTREKELKHEEYENEDNED